MEIEKLLEHYDYLARLAASRTDSQADAEDLVSETLLAALDYQQRGRVIEHPRTFLANILIHKHNSALRRKYRQPQIIELDMLYDVGESDEGIARLDNGETAEACRAESAELRRQVNCLARLTREVLIGYYFAGRSVAELAKQHGVPEGTIKSRLSAGRSQLRKGMEQMETTENRIPATLHVCNSGSTGRDDRPISVVEGDLIVQNLLVIAYKRPLGAVEISRAIGIPTVYIEPILEKLTDGELMVKTEGGKYYTDFIIFEPENCVTRFEGQQSFVRENFDVIGGEIKKIIDRLGCIGFVRGLTAKKRTELERYAILRALQRFQIEAEPHSDNRCPPRRDGGRWIAFGWKFESGRDYSRYNELGDWVVQGGHRTSDSTDCAGAKRVCLYEFDVPFWDNPHRFAVCGFHNYFNGIIKLLWCLHQHRSPEEAGVNNALIESIPRLIENTGLIARSGDGFEVDVPVLSRAEYAEIDHIVSEAFNALNSQIGDKYRDFLRGSAVRVPPQLEASVPTSYRLIPASNYIVMSAVREAAARRIHMHDVNYCCPPVLLVYE